MKIALTFAAVLVLTLVAWGPVYAAPAQTSAMQHRLDTILIANPGGTQVNATTIEWANGLVVLELAPASVGTCATGRFCAYSGLNLTGSKISYAACSTYTVSAFTVHSLANARSSKSVQGKNSSGNVLTTVGPGAQVNSTPVGVVKLQCG